MLCIDNQSCSYSLAETVPMQMENDKYFSSMKIKKIQVAKFFSLLIRIKIEWEYSIQEKAT